MPEHVVRFPEFHALPALRNDKQARLVAARIGGGCNGVAVECKPRDARCTFASVADYIANPAPEVA